MGQIDQVRNQIFNSKQIFNCVTSTTQPSRHLSATHTKHTSVISNCTHFVDTSEQGSNCMHVSDFLPDKKNAQQTN